MIIEIGTSDFRTQAGQVDGVFIEPVKYYFDRMVDMAIERFEGGNVLNLEPGVVVPAKRRKDFFRGWRIGLHGSGTTSFRLSGRSREQGPPADELRAWKRSGAD